MLARDIVEFEFQRALDSTDQIAGMRERIEAGDVLVARGVVARDEIARIRSYLAGIGRGSLPNYHPIAVGAPNFHRLAADERSYVQGSFHQFCFFPWNMDVLDLFARMRPIYVLNNRINRVPDDHYLKRAPDRGCIARLSFQHYPRGAGWVARHEDVAGDHKITTVTLVMSDKGAEYREGGTYVQRRDGGDLVLDDDLACGDLTIMHSNIVHGVQLVDPGANVDWLSFAGKWSLILAVNKLAGNASIGDSVQK